MEMCGVWVWGLPVLCNLPLECASQKRPQAEFVHGCAPMVRPPPPPSPQWHFPLSRLWCRGVCFEMKNYNGIKKEIERSCGTSTPPPPAAATVVVVVVVVVVAVVVVVVEDTIGERGREGGAERKAHNHSYLEP